MNLYDTLMTEFLRDAKTALQEKDKYIRRKFLNSPEVDGFYKERAKGIATWSITEPILKFIIFTELCDKYKMRPEDCTYKSSELLDLALFVEEQNEIEFAEIGIEMKWAVLTKKSLLVSSSLKSLKADFVKIKKSATAHNYLLQFILHEPSVEIQLETLENQVVAECDGRSLRYFTPAIVGIEQFPTWLSNETDVQMFSLLLWKVNKKD